MSRKLMAVFLSSALAFGSVSTSAWSANDPANSAQTATVQTVVNNKSPLPPAGAAGIKEAQGIENSPWLGIGLVVLFVGVAWLLLDDDEEEEDSTPGT
jgi:hypothetical protein